MNKRMKRFVSVLLAVLVVTALSVSALAEGESYTIRIYAGNVGATVNGGAVAQITAGYGEDITFDSSWVSLPADSQYYVRGVRESGLDNNTVSNNVIHVTEDADYVVAYGIRGALVAYTVNFVDEAGNELAASQTYYGNVGDKPVVANLYIDGYQPQAYNLTRTLSDNEAGNVFTFVYSQIVVPTPEPAAPTATPNVYTEGAEAPAEGGEEAGAPEEIGGEAVPEGAPETAPEAAPETEPEAEQEQEPEQAEIAEEETPLNNAPQEIIDLDEEDTPLGDKPAVQEKPKTELQKDREEKETKFYISTGLLAASLATIVVLVVLLVRKRKV